MSEDFEPTEIARNEPLARFSYSRSDYRTSDGSVKSSLFKPLLNDGRFELSVFRIVGMSEDQSHSLGTKHGESRPGRYRGHARVTADVVFEKRLKIEPDNIPPRHANVVGWPSKDAMMLIAQELAESAEFCLTHT